MLGYELDFNSCAIRDGFCKSSHIIILFYSMTVKLSASTFCIFHNFMCYLEFGPHAYVYPVILVATYAQQRIFVNVFLE